MPPKRYAEADAKAAATSKRAKPTPAGGKEDTEAQASPAKSRRVKKSTAASPVVEEPKVAKDTTYPSKKGTRGGRTKETNITDSTIATTITPAIIKPSEKANGVKKAVRKSAAKVVADEKEASDPDSDADKPKQPTKTPVKRKTKEEKEAEAMPLKPRTSGLRMFVGAHVSGGGGVQNSVTNALHIGGNAFALFLKSQRKWVNPALKDEHRDEFKNLCNHHGYAAGKHILPHGSYLVNLAQVEKEKADQAYDTFLDDLKRCEALGIKLYNFHPGNTGPHPRSEAISRISQQLNKSIKATSTVIPVLETMAGGGNAIGSTFEDLRDIIFEVEDKTRIGVCIDTCHIFAAGYDIRTPEAFKKTIDHFDGIVGLKYLRGFHMNDSKAPFNSHRDLHQNIGVGFLGLRAFHNVMNDPRFEDIPMVLETPTDVKGPDGKTVENKNIWAEEIKLLESLIGMDVASEEFLTLEKDLAARGAAERSKLQEQVDKKITKNQKKSANAAKKKKKQQGENGDGESDGSD